MNQPVFITKVYEVFHDESCACHNGHEYTNGIEHVWKPLVCWIVVTGWHTNKALSLQHVGEPFGDLL